ncbi:MAG: hypothetical protein WCR67_03445 [Bacilli bacterium]
MEIENQFLRIAVSNNGGSMTSIYDKKRSKELLYQPIPNSWKGQDVFIFPFIARLKDGNYQVKGKTYEMKNHGLIRYMAGNEMKMPNGDINISFASNEETLKQYPFDFAADSNYHLDGRKLTITYRVSNTGNEDMPFMIGAHPAFMLPGKKTRDEFDISGNYLLFAKRYHMKRIFQDDSFSYCIGEEKFRHSDKIMLSKELFNDINTIILKAKEFDYVDLIKVDGSAIRISKPNISYLAIWSDTQWGNYVAIEPWEGIPDELCPEKEMSKKKAIKILKPGENYIFSYSIEIIR